MEDQANKPKDISNREMAIRSSAIDMAIRAGCAVTYGRNDVVLNDPNRLVYAASIIEQYIKNGKAEPFIDGHSNNPNNPDTRFKELKQW